MAGMTDERCNELLDAWDQCNRELAELADCRTCDDDPVAREGELLETLDEIEYEFGVAQLDGHQR